MRILIADNHAMVREGLCALINAQPQMEVVGHSGNSQEVCQLARELRPDVALISDMLADLSGARVTERLLSSCPATKVLAMATFQDEVHVRQFLNAGAAGYVLKRASIAVLLDAMRTVNAGCIFIDPCVAHWVARPSFYPGDTKKENELTARESEVLLEVAWGYTNLEIASRLHLSVKTIEGHKLKIGQKTGMGKRSDMTLYAVRRGWMADV